MKRATGAQPQSLPPSCRCALPTAEEIFDRRFFKSAGSGGNEGRRVRLLFCATVTAGGASNPACMPGHGILRCSVTTRFLHAGQMCKKTTLYKAWVEAPEPKSASLSWGIWRLCTSSRAEQSRRMSVRWKTCCCCSSWCCCLCLLSVLTCFKLNWQFGSKKEANKSISAPPQFTGQRSIARNKKGAPSISLSPPGGRLR